MLEAAAAWAERAGMQGGERLCVHSQESSLFRQAARSCSGPTAQLAARCHARVATQRRSAAGFSRPLACDAQCEQAQSPGEPWPPPCTMTGMLHAGFGVRAWTMCAQEHLSTSSKLHTLRLEGTGILHFKDLTQSCVRCVDPWGNI